MPIYEFTCNGCGALVSVFVRSMNSQVNGKCERCGSTDLSRRVSRFAVLGTGSMDEESLMAGLDENDPRAMAAWARRMRDEMGDDAGPEFDDMVQRLESGESLEDMAMDSMGGDDHSDE